MEIIHQLQNLLIWLFHFSVQDDFIVTILKCSGIAFLFSGPITLFLRIMKTTRPWRKRRKLKKKVQSGKFMTAEEFKKNWIIEKGYTGLKYDDFSGCYIITIYDKSPSKGFKNYDNIYIGQSENCMHRVFNHITGKGNGDVYADIRAGRKVYISIVPCREKDMNDMEKDLIEAFDYQKAYNKTKGGGQKR